MRPHRLEIEAFGPYAEPVLIPFDGLARDGLFLIHGSTGAGKTYLLDALCFALYGEVSGERSLKGLRSDHASPTAVPRVALEFSAAGERWRVERSPACTLPKSRGSGTSSRGPRASLLRLPVAPDGAVTEAVARTPAEVTREITALVGLDGARFRQVILLPQGRFAEVLRARTEEREALLKTLFDTTLFEQASFWLDDQARAARGAVLDGERELEGLQEQAIHIATPWWSALADAEPETGAPETRAPKEAPPQGMEIALLVERLEAEEALCQAALSDAGDSLERARRQQGHTASLAERWDRRAAALQRLAERQPRSAAIEALRQALIVAGRAEILRSSLRAEREARAALTEGQRRLQERLLQAQRARDQASALPEAVQGLALREAPAPGSLARASRALATRRTELEGLATLAREAEGLRRSAAAAATAALDASGRVEKGEQLLAASDTERVTVEARLAAARRSADRLDGLQRADAEARDRRDTLEQLVAARSRESAAREQAVAAEEMANRARACLLELRERQLAGMAARLAADLRSGQPCPVCGAIDHPQPAAAGADPVADPQIAAAERERAAAEERARRAAAERARRQAERQALEQRLGEPTPNPDAIRIAAAEASEALALAQQEAAEAPALERRQQELVIQVQRYGQRLQELREQATRQRQQAEDGERRAAELSARVAAELGEELSPAAVLEGFLPLEQALEALGGVVDHQAQAASRAAEAQRRLAEDLAASGFANAAQAEAALREEHERLQWQERIRAFDEEGTGLAALLEAPDLQDLPEERPDTAMAEGRVLAADGARSQALERRTRAEAARSELQRLAERHGATATALQHQRERADLVGRVAERCLGRSHPHISLQRWVLSAYLAEICRFANLRLDLMTAGRYELRLSDVEGRRGVKAGLGLRVLDAYTGEEREVSSLSGGETFQASLALALGVADTVQAHSGGLALETLFIDEGFGSLDPDNLQLAMDELDRLRQGGRLVGIISHVGALRERIRQGIEVIAGERGSQVVVGEEGIAP